MRQLPARARAAILAVIGVVVFAAVFFLLARPGRVDLARYAPESTMLFVSVDSVPDLARQIARSDGWARLAPAAGVARELEYAGPVADALARAGIGSDEAVALGRAQIAVAVTSVEAETQAGGLDDEGAAVVIKPSFALLIETHLSERSVGPVVAERLPELARRAYGEQVVVEPEPYGGVVISTARPPAGERQMAWAVKGGLVVVGNHRDSVRAVLDVVTGRAPSLATSFYLERVRKQVQAERATVFAYVSQSGAGRLVGLAPGAIAGTLTADPERATTVARLFAGLAERAVLAVGYSGRFEEGRFADRYFTLLAPGLAESVAASMRPPAPSEEVASLIPPDAAEATVLRVERPGEAWEALLAAVSSRVDVAVSATISQIAIEIRRQYGVVPEDPVSSKLGDEIAFVGFGEAEPAAAIFAVREQSGLLPTVERYLRADGARLSSETSNGVEVLRSSHEDGRAASFVGRYLILGTRDQIARMAAAGPNGGARTVMRELLRARPEAISLGVRDDRASTAETFLALSGALRHSEGASPAEVPLTALDGLPPATSVTVLRDGGIFGESRSAFGSLSYLTLFL